MKVMRFKTGGIVVLGAVLTILSTPSAKADIVTSLVGAPVADSANHGYDYTYDVQLTNNEQLSTVNRNVTPQYATLYGLAASQPKILNVTGLLASDFSFTWSAAGSSTYSTTPAASALYNVRYTFTASNTTLTSGAIVYRFGSIYRRFAIHQHHVSELRRIGIDGFWPVHWHAGAQRWAGAPSSSACSRA